MKMSANRKKVVTVVTTSTHLFLCGYVRCMESSSATWAYFGVKSMVCPRGLYCYLTDARQ